MKITAFNPHVITEDAEPVTELFEALGFERRHKKDVDDYDTSIIRMKDANGFHVDITQTATQHKDIQIGNDGIAIRINDQSGASYKKGSLGTAPGRTVGSRRIAYICNLYI